MKFTETLWQSIELIYAQILSHPFVQGLTDGSLDESAFKFYVIQDALYLQDFGRGLAILGTKADDDGFLMFCDHARNAILAERSLHENFFQTWSLKAETVYQTPPAPHCLLYTSYLIRVALTRPYSEAIAAFLPCYWIYLKVGQDLMKKGSINPLYQQWIDTYSSDEFEAIVQSVLSVTNTIAASLTDRQIAAMKHHFILTSKMEYLFWDMGYQQQSWQL